jgi:hypothetical protein
MLDTANPLPGHKVLDTFVGKWKTSGCVRDSAGNKTAEVTGTDIYEWLPGNFFLLHKADVIIDGSREQTTEIIGFDQSAKEYFMHYFDNHGNSGTMKARLTEGTWTFLSESLRFTGAFSEDGHIMSGKWEQCADGKNWMPWMDIKLSR